ncbi:MAG: sulfite exporter TauE/SafE family protein [Dehalococcoidia bacterium]
MEAGVILVVLAAALLAGVAQGLTGFGFALIVVPMLLFVVDVQEAVVMSSALGTVSVALVSMRSWRHVSWPLVLRLLAGSFAGMPVGLLILLFAPQEPLRIAVALAVLVMALGLTWGYRLPAGGTGRELAVGAFSGVLRTSTSLAGPPVVFYLQARAFEPPSFRATLVMFFLVGNIVALAAFVATSVVTSRSIVYSAIALPLVFVGVAGGDRLLGRIDPVLFRRLVLALLVGTALSGVGLSLQRLLG